MYFLSRTLKWRGRRAEKSRGIKRKKRRRKKRKRQMRNSRIVSGFERGHRTPDQRESSFGKLQLKTAALPPSPPLPHPAPPFFHPPTHSHPPTPQISTTLCHTCHVYNMPFARCRLVTPTYFVPPSCCLFLPPLFKVSLITDPISVTLSIHCFLIRSLP